MFQRIKAYLDVITRANSESLKEMLRMSKSALTLDKIFEEAGLVARWEARGEAKGEARGIAVGAEKKAAEIAKNLLKNGFSVEQTAVLAGLDVVKVKALE
jgi:predicted transposase YdaD